MQIKPNEKTQETIQALKAALVHRDVDVDFDAYAALYSDKKTLQLETEALQNQRNTMSKEIGALKAQSKPIDDLLNAMAKIKTALETKKSAYDAIDERLQALTLRLPNPLHPSVPEGTDESDNQVVSTWSQPKVFSFDVADHVALGEQHKEMDFHAAATVSKSRFVYLQGDIAMLHRALAQWMINLHVTEHGYQEVHVPLLVNADALQNTGLLPKFAEDLFFIQDQNLALIPTAEVPLVNLFANRMLNKEALPIRVVAHSPCFRSEAGSYGQDTRGMIRQHQFEKVELVALTSAEESQTVFESMCRHAELVLEALQLPYQKVLKCSGDTGFTAQMTYDLEVWIPSQDCYREISSVSHCGDFQAKRMKTRYKDPNTKAKNWVHTLNGSALAVGRTLVALLENHQNEDGCITIPEVLQPYMHGKQSLHPKA